MIFNIKVSHYLLAAAALAHAGALPVVLTLALPFGVTLGLILAVTVSATNTLRHIAQRDRGSIAALRRTADGAWQLRTRADPDWRTASLAGSLRHPLLVIVHLRLPSGGMRHVPVLWDALGAEDFRRLRVALAAPAAGMPEPGPA